MRLSFQMPHLSISAFPEVDVPPFTVIIGLNGSGKSHLLQAIANGCISNSIVGTEPHSGIYSQPNIKLLGQDSRGPDLEQSYVMQGQFDREANAVASFEQLRAEQLARQRTALDNITDRKIAEILKPGEDVWHLEPTEVAHRLGESDVSRVSNIFAAAETDFATLPFSPRRMMDFGSGIPPIEMQAMALRIAARLGISPLRVTMQQMKLFVPWGVTDQFATNLPLLFCKYRDALVQNRLLRMSEENIAHKTAISEDDFIATFGRPPWEDINEILSSFALPYEVYPPSLYNFESVGLHLRKFGTEHFVTPQHLSSGEKVLLQFALSSLQYDEQFMSVTRPKLLLLDELDASLHPEMVNRWLGAVQRGLVEVQGVHCIITTHSPTTVALAPESSLFEMKGGHSGLSKISKQDALNRLTFGVPTLSINYSGRRQVFTESDTDAAIYEEVYALIKSHIQCDRELNFLSTGLRKKNNGEINAGCTIVKQTVERLAELGNSSIFGIIDWDGNAVSTNRIKVLAEGERNGIENVLLDPLLIAFLLMKKQRLPEGLEDIDLFLGVPNLEHYDLQRLIDAIQIRVFPDATERVKVSYLGGKTGSVLRQYLEANDHALEDALAEKFPALKEWTSKGRGKLVQAVVSQVLRELTPFCPVALPAIFQEIANADV